MRRFRLCEWLARLIFGPPMGVGLNTHFGYVIGGDYLTRAHAVGYRLARIDGQNCTTAIMLEQIAEAEAAGFRTLTTVWEAARVRLLAGKRAEFWNEPDGDHLPGVFRRLLDEACAAAYENDVELWAPGLSNTDRDSLRWLEAVRDAGGGWPRRGLRGISLHTYGPFPHDGFATREEEWAAARAACAGRPFIVTEFGWANTTGFTEEQQAAVMRKEWLSIEAAGAREAYDFQMLDGTDPDQREHRYGSFRCDAAGVIGELKPKAYVIPDHLIDEV